VTVATATAGKAIGDNSGTSTVCCSSAREAKRWQADLAKVTSKVAGDGVAGELTTGERLFRWPGQQQRQQQ